MYEELIQAMKASEKDFIKRGLIVVIKDEPIDVEQAGASEASIKSQDKPA